MALINCSICLSDIPKANIKVANNGKAYANITVQELREVDEYGNTHSVSMSQTKEERDEKVKRTYIGRGKMWSFHTSTPTAEEVSEMPKASASVLDDLPF